MNLTMSHNPRSGRRRREPVAAGRLPEANDTGINRTRRMKDLERGQPAAGRTGPGAGVNGRRGGEDLAVLIERSAELKRDLVDFACSPRLERSLAAAMLEAGLEEVEEADAIGTIDRFALQYRLPDGKTVVDRFVASRPDLDAADREMLLGWRDPVEGIFEIRGQDGDAMELAFGGRR